MKPETTALTPVEERAFQEWVRANGIADVDDPRSRYDYRGYWKRVASRGSDQRKAYDDGLHFPDTFKQHGHPTFSVESQYSAGPHDGGRWIGEDYVPAGADLLRRAHGPQAPAPYGIEDAIRALIASLGMKL